MYSSILKSLMALDSRNYSRYDAVTEVLTIADDKFEMTVSPTIFTLSAVTYTANVMDRAKSLPLTKDQLVIIHHDMFLNETDWAECCEISREELTEVVNFYKDFG